MPLNAFVIRPFGKKTIITPNLPLHRLHPLIVDPKIRAKVEELQRNNPIDPLRHNATFGNSELARESLIRVIDYSPDQGWKIEIDFDDVHDCMIEPALQKLRILGGTTGEVIVAGNIREEMFNRLVTADLVIADVSIHNPNVFYELGIRQAFRDKYTFLMRCDLSDYPFDLRTDRYLEYNLFKLGTSGDSSAMQLADALQATISSYKADSPVFKLLPTLEAEDRARFIAVPSDFSEEVHRAQRNRVRGREDLRLLAVECQGTLWEVEGLREVGRAQFESNYIRSAKLTWEQIASRYPDDVEANTVLSTIYQRVGDDTRSNQALARVSRAGSLGSIRWAQLRALHGRNLKESWIKQWRDPVESNGEATGAEGAGRGAREAQQRQSQERETRALRSPLLYRAYQSFEEAFMADLNNGYAGLNALSLLVMQIELAERYPDIWRNMHRADREAEAVLIARRARQEQLIAALELAIESQRARIHREGGLGAWFSLDEAATACIVSDQPEHVRQLFEEAVYWAPRNAERSMRRALEVYRLLGIKGRDPKKNPHIGTIGLNVERALQVLDREDLREATERHPKRILVFVGLRVNDESQRTSHLRGSAVPLNLATAGTEKRIGFPPAFEENAKLAIADAIEAEIVAAGEARKVLAVAGGSCGGDILFHEICLDRGVPSRMCLSLPKDTHVGEYVATGGSSWVDRFTGLYQALGKRNVFEICDTTELPRWLHWKRPYNVGRRGSMWMIQHALIEASRNDEETQEGCEITLLVLSDDKTEMGPGGLGYLMNFAAKNGIKVVKIGLERWQSSHVAAVPAPASVATRA